MGLDCLFPIAYFLLKRRNPATCGRPLDIAENQSFSGGGGRRGRRSRSCCSWQHCYSCDDGKLNTKILSSKRATMTVGIHYKSITLGFLTMLITTACGAFYLWIVSVPQELSGRTGQQILVLLCAPLAILAFLYFVGCGAYQILGGITRFDVTASNLTIRNPWRTRGDSLQYRPRFFAVISSISESSPKPDASVGSRSPDKYSPGTNSRSGCRVAVNSFGSWPSRMGP